MLSVPQATIVGHRQPSKTNDSHQRSVSADIEHLSAPTLQSPAEEVPRTLTPIRSNDVLKESMEGFLLFEFVCLLEGVQFKYCLDFERQERVKTWSHRHHKQNKTQETGSN